MQGVRWNERGGTPIAHIESYIPTEFRTVVDTFWSLDVPFYSVLEKSSGRTIDEVTQEIRAVEMPASRRQCLRIAGGEHLASAYAPLHRPRRRPDCVHQLAPLADQYTYQMVIHRRIDREQQ